jgi:hypothetical protein
LGALHALVFTVVSLSHVLFWSVYHFPLRPRRPSGN